MTTRLWTPADLARTPVSWLDCDSARVDSDAQGVVGVYDRQGHLYRPLTGYAAHRLGVVHLNGRRWLGGSDASDTNLRLALCSLTASGWFQGASGITVVAAFHRFQLANTYQGLWAINNVDETGAPATTQVQAMLRLAPASTENGNLLFNFRRLSSDPGGTKTKTTGLSATGGFVASERLDAINARTSLHVGPVTSWGPLAADAGVTPGRLNGCSSSAYQVMFGAERANIAGAPDIALGEALLFDHALTDDEVARVEGYLAHRWGLTASLPEAHAYKREAPKVELADAPIGPSAEGIADTHPATAGTLLLSQNAEGDFGLCPHATQSGLALDPSLASAVLVSLFSDARIDADEADRLGIDDQRGWWADSLDPADGAWGSRLWALDRAKPTPEAARQAEDRAKEALGWLIEDGVADRVDCSALWRHTASGARLELTVRVTASPAAAVRFGPTWEATYAL